jgi:DoxX-like family
MVRRALHRDGGRLELVLIWLGTALASVWDGGRKGQALLVEAGISATTGLLLVWAGAAWDLAIGAWLLLKPSAQAYATALISVLALTLMATLLLPQLWADPLGPLLKNLAVMALLAQRTRRDD